MNDKELELVKAAAEGTAAGLTRSLQDILLNLAGPMSKEIGLELGEMAKIGRLRRTVERAQRALEILAERGAVRRSIPLATLVPLLEAASLETDAALQERWSQLLASAADADCGTVTRAFSAILQELTPEDARLLDWVLDHEPEPDQNVPEMLPEVSVDSVQLMDPPRVGHESIMAFFNMLPDDFLLTCSRLERIGVCDVGRYVFPTRSLNSGTGPRRYDSIALTPLGIAFVKACRGH